MKSIGASKLVPSFSHSQLFWKAARQRSAIKGFAIIKSRPGFPAFGGSGSVRLVCDPGVNLNQKLANLF